MKKKLRRRAIGDFICIAIVNAIAFFIFAKIELFELIYNYSRKYESYEIDELASLAITLTISALFFAVRRWKDLSKFVSLVEKEAMTDSLTKLFNRRSFYNQLDIEYERYQRQGDPLSLIMLDIDNFKVINDTRGHLVGDEVLVSMANDLKDNIRKMDVIARWGGEEFVILCAHTSCDDAFTIAEKLRLIISESTTSQVPFTASLGVAQFSEGESIDNLLSRVDHALYAAKDDGKNCVKKSASVQ